MTKKTKARNAALPLETFVRVWMESKSISDFCTRTGMRKDTASVRAHRLRTYGIHLPNMHGCTKSLINPTSVADMNKLIDSKTRK